MSIKRRIEHLEAVIPEPEPDVDRRWYDCAPPAVHAYYGVLNRELVADPRCDVDDRAAIAALIERHPGLPAIAGAVVEAITLGYDPLACAQAALLRNAYHRLGWAVSRERCSPGWGPTNEACDWAEAAWRMTADTRETYNGFWADRSGSEWPAVWRARGTHDPATLAAMQLGDPELELLAATGAV